MTWFHTHTHRKKNKNCGGYMFLSMTGFESMHQAVNNPNPGLPRNAWQNLTLHDICWHCMNLRHCMTSYDSVSHMLHNVWYIYLQNWDMLFGQMLGFIFQHHASHRGSSAASDDFLPISTNQPIMIQKLSNSYSHQIHLYIFPWRMGFMCVYQPIYPMLYFILFI